MPMSAGWWLWGFEIPGSLADIKGSGNCGVVALNCNSTIDGIITYAGRLGGVILQDRALVYVKGGAAWAHDKFSANFGTVGGPSADGSRWGWMWGTGVEYMLGISTWSMKAEYNFIDLQSKQRNVPGFLPFEVTERIHLIKFGLNYHLVGI
jgi:outer membrane immunogenic protein